MSLVLTLQLAGLALLAPQGDPIAKAPDPAISHQGDDAGTNDAVDEDSLAASALRKRAEEAFAKGDLEQALRAFRDAHERSPHPTDLFNMGRIEEEQGDLSAALDHYEAFVGMPRLTLAQRDAAAERIEVLRKIVRTDAEPGSAGPRSPLSLADHSASPQRTRSLVLAGSVLSGVGAVLAVAGGVGFGLVARQKADEVNRLSEGENPDRLTLSETEEIHAEGRNAEALQITFLGVGATVAMIGAGVLAVGLLQQKKARSLALSPTVSAGGAGISARGRF